MASVGDVATALGQLIGATLYPSGASGEAASPVAGLPVRVEAGWPSPQSLDTALGAGKAHVSIYPLPAERNTTRYPAAWTDGPANPITYSLTAGAQTIAVGGAAPSTAYVQNLAAFVNGKPYLAQSTGTQTPAQLAAALQALIVADVAGTTVNGAVISLPASARIGALRLGSTAVSSKAVRLQEKRFQISVWAPSPASREAVANAFDPVLADTPFLSLADGQCRLHYAGSAENDFDQKQGVFRRDLFYTVEFPTVRSQTFTQITAEQANLADPTGAVIKTTWS